MQANTEADARWLDYAQIHVEQFSNSGLVPEWPDWPTIMSEWIVLVGGWTRVHEEITSAVKCLVHVHHSKMIYSCAFRSENYKTPYAWRGQCKVVWKLNHISSLITGCPHWSSTQFRTCVPANSIHNFHLLRNVFSAEIFRRRKKPAQLDDAHTATYCCSRALLENSLN